MNFMDIILNERKQGNIRQPAVEPLNPQPTQLKGTPEEQSIIPQSWREQPKRESEKRRGMYRGRNIIYPTSVTRRVSRDIERHMGI